jgi:hypothetical protein
MMFRLEVQLIFQAASFAVILSTLFHSQRGDIVIEKLPLPSTIPLQTILQDAFVRVISVPVSPLQLIVGLVVLERAPLA